MSPFSLFTYYSRHKGHTALFLGVINLATVGLYLMVALSLAIYVEPMRTNRQFLSKLNIVMPLGDELGAAVMAQVRGRPGVEQVIPFVAGQGISLPEVIGGDTNWFNLWGVWEEDINTVMEKCGATLEEGHLLQPSTNGIMITREVAAALNLHVGDIIHNTVNPRFYSNIADPLEVVAILESDVRLGILSAEYMNNHEIYQNFPLRFMITSKQGHESEVDNFLRNEIKSSQTVVWTLQTLNEQMAGEYLKTYVFIIPLIIIVATAVSLVIGTLNRIAFARRIPEFGILHAAGYKRRWLMRHLVAETATLALMGWTLGILISWVVLYGLKLSVFEPRGHPLSVITAVPALLVLLVPVAVVTFTQAGFHRLLSRMDVVTIIERSELGPEEQSHKPGVASSSPRPLSVGTFYRRHRGRTVLITGAMSLMIIAVAFVIFFFSATSDAQRARLGDLIRMSSIRTRFGSHADMGVISQVRANTMVDRVIPCAQMTMLDISIPPFERVSINPYGVYAEDMAYIVELYDLELKEGHLPRPHTNEIVIPEIVAQNRDLHIGDVLGNREYPAYLGAPALPADFIISGIFAKSTVPENENWLAFVSLEFLQYHESFAFFGLLDHFLVVPKIGQKVAMDDWLVSELGKYPEMRVMTYDQSLAHARESTRTSLLTMALIESGVAVVAAVALAVLNVISIAQRQTEFGLLHALGHPRPWLVGRTVRETVFATGAAWVISAVVCLVGMVYLQLYIFIPLGLRFNLFSLTPWLFTLPIPVTVLLATAGTVSRTLSKLDPVTVIERR
jgi:ABC-type lipoprotein release transport system permease subunit